MDMWAGVAAAEAGEESAESWSRIGGSCAFDCRGWFMWESERKKRWWSRVPEGPRGPPQGWGLTGGRGFTLADFFG